MTPNFDPSRAIVFDLARGQLRDDEGNARLNLPATALLRLCQQAGVEAQKDFAQSLGSEIGRRIADKLGKSARDASLQTWAEHLGGQLALVGFGDLSVEQWGQALVLRVADSPEGMVEMLAQLLAATLQRAMGRDARLVAFEDGSVASYLVVSEKTAQKVVELKGSGAGLGQVVDQLQKGAA